MFARFAFILFCLLSFNTMALAPNDPYELVKYVADKTLKRIEAESKQIERNPEFLKHIVREELMPHIDYHLAAMYILANTTADEAGRTEFSEAFGRYLTTTYATLFSKYEGQKLLVDKPLNIEGRKIVGVSTVMKDIDGPDRNIEFKLKRNKTSGRWAVFDVVIEGVSLLQSKKAEIKPMLRQVDGLFKATKLLNDKAQNRIQL